MKRALLPLSLCLLFVIAVPLFGEEPLRLSLEDCETRSLSANRTLLRAELAAGQARLAARVARLTYIHAQGMSWPTSTP